MSALECTYLVIGAGNAGVSFADAIVPMVPDATVILADRNDRPGGHWTHAYPFVSLHQPAAGYGVLSRELSVLTVDRAGVNKGYEALASGQEVEAYMKRTVHELEGTGRLRFLGLHEWVPERGVLRSLVTGKDVPVKFKKIVFGNHQWAGAFPCGTPSDPRRAPQHHHHLGHAAPAVAPRPRRRVRPLALPPGRHRRLPHTLRKVLHHRRGQDRHGLHRLADAPGRRRGQDNLGRAQGLPLHQPGDVPEHAAAQARRGASRQAPQGDRRFQVVRRGRQGARGLRLLAQAGRHGARRPGVPRGRHHPHGAGDAQHDQGRREARAHPLDRRQGVRHEGREEGDAAGDAVRRLRGADGQARGEVRRVRGGQDHAAVHGRRRGGIQRRPRRPHGNPPLVRRQEELGPPPDPVPGHAGAVLPHGAQHLDQHGPPVPAHGAGAVGREQQAEPDGAARGQGDAGCGVREDGGAVRGEGQGCREAHCRRGGQGEQGGGGVFAHRGAGRVGGGQAVKKAPPRASRNPPTLVPELAQLKMEMQTRSNSAPSRFVCPCPTSAPMP